MDTQDTNKEQVSTSQKPSKKLQINTGTAIVTAGFIIALAILISGGIKKNTGSMPTQKEAPTRAATPTTIPKEVAKVRDTDFVFGNNNAPVVVFEYVDTDCIFCQKFHTTMHSVVKAYDGKVAWVARMFPIPSLHPNATTEAAALTCVGKLGGAEKYWSYFDSIINITLAADAKANEQLFSIADGLGIKKADLKTCMADASTENAIKAAAAEAVTIGAQGTPFSVAVNVKTGEQKVIAGAYPEDEVKKMIDELLK